MFSKCYDTQVQVTGPSWPSCLNWDGDIDLDSLQVTGENNCYIGGHMRRVVYNRLGDAK